MNKKTDSSTLPYEKGIYVISLNSIDNMIFRVAALMDGYETKFSWSAPKSCKDKTKTFFKIHRSKGIKDTRKYAAKVSHLGDTYVAGPPNPDENTCDNSGTVLTLIGEIIKLNEENAELRNQVTFTGLN